jgi:hypothetical protein
MALAPREIKCSMGIPQRLKPSFIVHWRFSTNRDQYPISGIYSRQSTQYIVECLHNGAL